jgi:C4-dicarboxylate-specific signal transduction histidine kinase
MSDRTEVVYRFEYPSLIENVFDATPQGGTSAINSKKFDGNVAIALTHTGSGIAENVMENPWQPLQTTKPKGLGFGVSDLQAHCGRSWREHVK